MDQLRGWIGWGEVDWERVFVPDTPLLETVVRGSATYLVLFVLLRTALKRETGGLSIPDLLVIVLLAEASQNALADDYASIPDGALLIGTVICWDYALNWLGYRFPRVQALVHPRALPLVADGKPIHRNLRQELLTVEELMSLLRLQGVDDLSQVRRAYMEGDGRVSVVTTSADAPGPGQANHETRMRG